MAQALAQYPSSVWNGLSGHKDRVSLNDDIRPNAKDWDQIVAEVRATQTKLDSEAGNIDTLQSSLGTAESDIGTLQSDIGTLETDLGTLETDLGDLTDVTHPSGTTGGFQLNVAESTGTATAAVSFDIPVAVPAGCWIQAVQLRVDTALTSSDGGTAWTAAYSGGLSAEIVAAQAFAKNTKANAIVPGITTAPTNITITADSAKTFEAGGVVRAIVYYRSLAAMADAA